jgi:hypothetical protein
MIGRTTVLIAASIVALACKPDPAKSVKIVAPPPAPPAAQAALPPWDASFCALPPEDSTGKSKFVATGPCAFHHEGNTLCRGLTDDFHVIMLRKGPGASTVSVYINVEFYKGSGRYSNAQMFLTYQNGTSYYLWGSDSVHITVTAGQKSVVLPKNKLEAEPPNTGTEVVSGTLWCGAPLDLSGATNPRG